MITKSEIKFIKSLNSKKNRLIHKCFVVEGEKSVLELLDSDFKIVQLYATNQWQLKSNKLRINRITDSQLKQISGLQTPNKALAIVQFPHSEKVYQGGITLVLDDIQDPGNLGTIVRLSNWFGVKQIICSFHSVDVYNPKVVQSSMGSIFRVNVLYTDLYKYLRVINEPIYGGFMEGDNVKEMNLPKDCHLILGNESNGISDKLLPLIDKRVSVQSIGAHSESLNVGVAAGILLYEFSS